jgi:hypothetical protein
MAGLNNLLYSFLFIVLFITSANAEWKMHSAKDTTFMYNTESGEIYRYQHEYQLDNGKVQDATFVRIGYHFHYIDPASERKRLNLNTKDKP